MSYRMKLSSSVQSSQLEKKMGCKGQQHTAVNEFT